MAETRIPTQKRSIEKRNKIIENGFKLMCEKGYFNVSTPDIAEASSVSTGIIYQYFNDKKDIFIEGIKNYSNSIMFPMYEILENENQTIDLNNFKKTLNDLIDAFIKNHTISKRAHEELMAMSHLNEDIGKIFKETEVLVTDKLVKLFENNNIKLNNPREKLHLATGLIENFCHETVYHKHEEINYDIMKQEVIKTVLTILKN